MGEGCKLRGTGLGVARSALNAVRPEPSVKTSRGEGISGLDMTKCALGRLPHWSGSRGMPLEPATTAGLVDGPELAEEPEDKDCDDDMAGVVDDEDDRPCDADAADVDDDARPCEEDDGPLEEAAVVEALEMDVEDIEAEVVDVVVAVDAPEALSCTSA